MRDRTCGFAVVPTVIASPYCPCAYLPMLLSQYLLDLGKKLWADIVVGDDNSVFVPPALSDPAADVPIALRCVGAHARARGCECARGCVGVGQVSVRCSRGTCVRAPRCLCASGLQVTCTRARLRLSE